MPTEPIEFECVDCCEDKIEPAYRPNPQDAEAAWYICKECALEKILDMFQTGLKAETECPPRISGMDISIDDFADIFPAELVQAWPGRLREVGTLPRERVYCENCEGFLGAAGSDEALHCQKCDQAASGPSNEPAGDAEDHPFKDMTLGKDYQICPGCATPYELMDGCNHMTCTLASCRTEFCFICGEAATVQENHWSATRGICPLYHHPDEGREELWQIPAGQDEDDGGFAEWIDAFGALDEHRQAAIDRVIGIGAEDNGEDVAAWGVGGWNEARGHYLLQQHNDYIGRLFEGLQNPRVGDVELDQQVAMDRVILGRAMARGEDLTLWGPDTLREKRYDWFFHQYDDRFRVGLVHNQREPIEFAVIIFAAREGLRRDDERLRALNVLGAGDARELLIPTDVSRTMEQWNPEEWEVYNDTTRELEDERVQNQAFLQRLRFDHGHPRHQSYVANMTARLQAFLVRNADIANQPVVFRAAEFTMRQQILRALPLVQSVLGWFLTPPPLTQVLVDRTPLEANYQRLIRIHALWVAVRPRLDNAFFEAEQEVRAAFDDYEMRCHERYMEYRLSFPRHRDPLLEAAGSRDNQALNLRWNARFRQEMIVV